MRPEQAQCNHAEEKRGEEREEEGEEVRDEERDEKQEEAEPARAVHQGIQS
jgi:hypothetical protein